FLIAYPSGELLVMHAHSEFFETSFEMGAIGLTAFLFFLGFLIKCSFKSKYKTGFYFGAGILMLMITNLFGVNLRYFPSQFLFYTLAGLIAGTVPLKNKLKSDLKWGIILFLIFILIGFFGISKSIRNYLSDRYLWKANQLQYYNRSSEALEFYNKSVSLNKYNHFTVYNRFRTLTQIHNYNEALADFEMLNLEFPFYRDIHIQAAKIYTDISKFESAEEEFIKEESISRLSSDLYVEWGYSRFKNCFEQGGIANVKKRRDEIIEIYEKGLEINPGNVLLLDNLGNLYVLLGIKTEALRYFERAFQISQEQEMKILVKIIDLRIQTAGYKDAVRLLERYKEDITPEELERFRTALKSKGVNIEF
ncbi:MAG: hypothetical protein PHV06_06275, partial [bacterium]|nr:hypothetical protein [bacterium]